MPNFLSRITFDPEICHGRPIIRGMRWSVEVILDLLSAGMTEEEILNDHLELEKEDFLASIQFARRIISGENLWKICKIKSVED